MINAEATGTKLPVEYPITTSYPDVTNLLSILTTDNRTLPWILSNYLQVYCRKNMIEGGSFGYVFGEDNWDWPYISCPWIRTNIISTEIINEKWDSFIDFIMYCIDQGFYIIAFLNQYYIKVSRNYLKNDFLHETFIYGYEKKSKDIYIADFYMDGKYTFSKASFDEIENSKTCKIIPDSLKRVSLLKFEKTGTENQTHIKYHFDIDKVYTTIKEYLGKQNHGYFSRDDKNKAYGIFTYDALTEYLNETIKRCVKYCDVRPFHVFYEQKKMMVIRINYMLANKYLLDQGDFWVLYMGIERESMSLRNLMIKSNVLENQIEKDYLRGKAIQILSNIKSNEVLALEQILLGIEKI